KLADIVKNHGVVALAKLMIDDLSAHSISEPELTALITQHAKSQYPNLSPSAAFAKVFTAQTEEGATLRKGVAVAKNFPMMVTVTAVATDGQEDEDDALDQLNALVEEQRKRAPFKSTAQLFAEVYKNNPKLAAKEREQAHASNAEAMRRTLGLAR